MDSQKLKEKIKIAEESVKDMHDAELKKKAFEVILNKLINVTPDKHTKKQEPSPSEPKNVGEESVTKIFEPNKLADASGLSVEELGNIVDFDGNDFHVVAQIPGKSFSEQQKNAALLIITANYYCTGDREYDAGKLRKRLEDLGIKSLVNMATILQGFENYFVKKGEKGSRLTAYRITNPGLQEGIKLIKEIGGKNEGTN